MKFKNVFSKRILAGIVALTTVSATMSMLTTSATINSNMQYKVFNNYTSAVTQTYTLNALNTDTNTNTRGIINGENRQPLNVNANNGMVRIVSTEGDSYTGFVVGDNIIATAASNVYKLSTNSFKKINTIYLHDTNGNVTGTATASRVHIPTQYTNYHLADYDYALIKVTTDISSHKAFELGVPLPTLENTQQILKVTGFPDKINGVTNTNSYTGSGLITTFDSQTLNRQIAYETDVTDGQQGSPVYIYQEYKGVKYNVVVGINVSNDYLYAEAPYFGHDANCGIRMTTDMLHFYNNNPNI